MEAQENAVNITGSVSYRERIMPPPGSTVTVTLNDVSIADRAAPVLAKQTIDLDGQSVPVDFSLSVPSADIKPNMRYSVRATLNGPDGELLWTTDMANMIDTSGEASDLGMLVMKRTERK